jgi:spermidine/putrescine transport system substrate-binding protein
MSNREELNILLPAGMTRRHFLKLLAASGLGAAAAGSPPLTVKDAFAQENTLNYFTWDTWGEPQFVKFAEERGIRMRPTFYASSGEMVAKLRGGGTKFYDMIVPTEHYVQLAAQNGLVEPMDKSKFTYIKDIFPELVNPEGRSRWEMADGRFYGVPFVWGANAMAYLPKVTGELDSINALFDPKWKGRISMRDEPEDSIAVGALKLGIQKPYDMEEKALQEVKKLMISQKHLLRTYWKNTGDVRNLLASGEVVVTWAFLAVVSPLRSAGVDVGWVWPKEGALGWSEAVVAVKGTKKKELVERYANLTLSPEYALMMAKTTRYATSSKKAVEQMDPNQIKELGIDMANLKRIKFKEIPLNIARWNEIWNEVKAA